MTELQRDVTMAEAIFPCVVEKMGGEAVMRTILDANRRETAAGKIGVTLHNATDTVALSTNEVGMSVRYYGWGPYMLTYDQVDTLLSPIDPEV